jgi:hypothetical protein
VISNVGSSVAPSVSISLVPNVAVVSNVRSSSVIARVPMVDSSSSA